MRTARIALAAVDTRVMKAVIGAVTVTATGPRGAAVGEGVEVTTGAAQAWVAEVALAPLAWLATGIAIGMAVQTLGKVTVSTAD